MAEETKSTEAKSTTTTTSTSSAPVQKKGKSTTTIIIIIAVVLFLCIACSVGGYFGLKYLGDKAVDEIESEVGDLDEWSDTFDTLNDTGVTEEELGEGTWEEVLTLSGDTSTDDSTSIQSEYFTAAEPGWKVIYTITPNEDYTSFTAYAMTEDGSTYDWPAFLESESGETILTSTGEFYLDIYPTGCEWTIEVLQFVSAE